MPEYSFGEAERDFEKVPYTSCERRVCDYLQVLTNGQIGCGDDPIGFVIAAHSFMSSYYRCRPRIKQLRETIEMELKRQKKEGITEPNAMMLAEAIGLLYATNLLEDEGGAMPDVDDLVEGRNPADGDKAHGRVTPIDHAKGSGGSTGKVDDPALGEGAPVVHADDDAATRAKVGDTNPSAEGKGPVGT